MRVFTLSTMALVPAVLIAQAPADVAQILKTESPVIKDLVKNYKAKEALAKAEAMISVERPAYNTKDLLTVRQSQNEWRNLMNAYMLTAWTASMAGEWEKGVEILKKGVTLAKDNKAAFIANAQPTLDTWKKPEEEAKAFMAEKPARMKELQEDISKVEAEVTNQEAIKKMSKAEKKALGERQTKAQGELEELEQLKAAMPTHENNLKAAAQIHALVADTIKICDDDIAAITSAQEKAEAKVKKQADEIQDYNAKLKVANKKAVIKGNSNWVDAVMNGQENFMKLGSTDAQVGLLNRLLVLDPGNAKAQKALSNIQAGKAPFEAEKAPAKGKAKKTR